MSETGSMTVRRSTDTRTLRERIRADPRPALIWTAVAAGLLALQFGALLQFVATLLVDFAYTAPGDLWGLLGAARGLESFAESIPTLLSRETIPNDGYYNGSRYVGTFMGLEPKHAWFVRVGFIYAYSFGLLVWGWIGFDWYREHYRYADWTPRDDVIDRFRTHYWGVFGIVIVFLFIVMAVFAPALGPTTVQRNLENPYSYSMKYYDEDAGTVEEVRIGIANQQTQSSGADNNVAPMTYDQYGRFHPFGTAPTGGDLFTFLAAGSRISLLIGVLAVGLSATIAVSLALLSAYYKGRVDLGVVLVSDAVMAMPQLLLLIMLSVLLSDTWIGGLYNGGFMLALIFAGTGWPIMWRAFRGPSLQVSERDWIDAARSYGQRPRTIMRKHMLPYVLGYLLIYGSMTLGGAIIAIAGLSYLGLGVNPGTPEWGRAVKIGQPYVKTQSWHISFIPGALITIVVTGFNALGDGIRDVIDPESDSAAGEEAARGSGA